MVALVTEGTVKTKGFWLGLLLMVGGAVVVCVGDAAKGVELIIAGAVMICGRDTMQKLINNGKK